MTHSALHASATAVRALTVGAGALGAGYLAALTAASVMPRRPEIEADDVRFGVVVPAHDEAGGIGPTLDSLRSLDYPPHLVRAVVVADNCTDDTAGVASRAGFEVLERHDPVLRGKGYALAFAFDHLLADPAIDAVVVIDADSSVSPRLLRVLAGAVRDGDGAVQVNYRVRNFDASWRTRLMDVAFTCQHRVRGAGRERLGLSAGLRGNGMMFTRDVLDAVPYCAWSAVEDVEYGVQLGLAGQRVRCLDSVYVDGDMARSASASATQRVRWELGRREIATRLRPQLLRRLRERPDRVSSDLLADLVVPPVATIAVVVGAGATAAALTGGRPSRALALASVVGLIAHVAAGVTGSRSRRHALVPILMAPWFVLWKLTVKAASILRTPRGATTSWVRTERDTAHDDTTHDDTTGAAAEEEGAEPCLDVRSH